LGVYGILSQMVEVDQMGARPVHEKAQHLLEDW
jgi:hypothetical protein